MPILKIVSVIILLFVTSCSSVSYWSLYKSNKEYSKKNVVIQLIYQVPSSRIKEIIDAPNNQILFQQEIERIAKRYELTAIQYKQQQLSRVQTANMMYSEPLKSGLFTDRGRLFVKYGEPQSISDVDDQKLGKVQKWVYANPNKTFIFIINDSTNSYTLYNVIDEEMFK